MKKFELTEIKKEMPEGTMYRIRALTAFADVAAGELGGWVSKVDNLSQDGDAWVYDDAKVYGDATVCGNAMVYGSAKVCGNAMVRDDAKVCGNAIVCSDAWVYGNAKVYGDATVYGSAKVYGNATVCGDATVCGNATVCSDAMVRDDTDVMWITKIGSRNGTTTFYRTAKAVKVICGCFQGDIDCFEAKVREVHGENEHAQAYLLAIQLAKLRIKLD